MTLRPALASYAHALDALRCARLAVICPGLQPARRAWRRDTFDALCEVLAALDAEALALGQLEFVPPDAMKAAAA